MACEKSSPGMVKAREKRKSDRTGFNWVPGPERLEETLRKANSRPVGKHWKGWGLEAELRALPEYNHTTKF